MKIKPLGENVLLEIFKEEVDVGIILTDQYDDEVSVIGKVLEVGEHVPDDIKKDNLVLFKKHLFDEVVIGRTKKEIYLLGKAEAITAIVEK